MRATSCLPTLTGDFGQPSGGISPRRGGRCHGAAFNDLSASDRRPPGDYVPNQMEAIVEALERGAAKVFVPIGSNILLSFHDTIQLRVALGKADLVVAYDSPARSGWKRSAQIDQHLHPSDGERPSANGKARPVFELYKGLAGLNVYP